jgi:DNA-binding NarL/FixJ family response regulator
MAKQISETNGLTRILIVDDHPVFRDGLAGLTGREPDWTVCGVADNAQDALAAIERLKPALVLVDISLPGRSGLELIKDIRALHPATAALVISMHDEMLYAERVLRAGGRGYIMKQEGPEKILEAIRTVLAGQLYLSGKMSTRLLDSFSGHRGRAKSPISQLTDRQLEILQLTGLGIDSRTIARKLHLSFKTVDAHRAQIRAKLELKNYTELVSYAARWVEAQPASSWDEGVSPRTARAGIPQREAA